MPFSICNSLSAFLFSCIKSSHIYPQIPLFHTCYVCDRTRRLLQGRKNERLVLYAVGLRQIQFLPAISFFGTKFAPFIKGDIPRTRYKPERPSERFHFAWVVLYWRAAIRHFFSILLICHVSLTFCCAHLLDKRAYDGLLVVNLCLVVRSEAAAIWFISLRINDDAAPRHYTMP